MDDDPRDSLESNSWRWANLKKDISKAKSSQEQKVDGLVLGWLQLGRASRSPRPQRDNRYLPKGCGWEMVIYPKPKVDQIM